MRGLIALLGVAACALHHATDRPAAPDESPPGAVVPVAEPALLLARAVASRTEPLLVLAPPAVTSQGRCAIELAARPASETDRVRQAFEARNGAGWDLSFDELTGTIRSARHRTGSSRRSWDPNDRSHDGADQRATVDFVAKNYELFGYDADDLTAMKLGAFGTRLLTGKRPQPGYEAFSEVTRESAVDVWFDENGSIMEAIFRNRALPPFKLCEGPQLAATDPKLFAKVLPHALSFSNYAGQIVHSPPITMANVGAPALSIYVEWKRDPARVVLHLVYAIAVRDPEPWTFFVDPDTGDLLYVREDFIS
jgi:hypothetical protein